MEKLFLSEYVSDDQNKTAQVYKVLGQNCFQVDCYRSSEVIKSEIFLREHQADDFAEDWVLCQDEE